MSASAQEALKLELGLSFINLHLDQVASHWDSGIPTPCVYEDLGLSFASWSFLDSWIDNYLSWAIAAEWLRELCQAEGSVRLARNPAEEEAKQATSESGDEYIEEKNTPRKSEKLNPFYHSPTTFACSNAGPATLPSARLTQRLFAFFSRESLSFFNAGSVSHRHCGTFSIISPRMRSPIIYAFSIAVTLLGMASVVASPLPANVQPPADVPPPDDVPPSADAAEDLPVGVPTLTIRIGLFDPIKKSWVPLEADRDQRLKADYAPCISTTVCLHLQRSGSEERVVNIPPKLFDPEPTEPVSRNQLSSRAFTRRNLDSAYYEELDVGVLPSRLQNSESRLVKKGLMNLKELEEYGLGKESTSFAQGGTPFALAALSLIYSQGALRRRSKEVSKTFEEVYAQTTNLLVTLKADATDGGFIMLQKSRAHRREQAEYNRRRGPKRKQPETSPSQNPPVPFPASNNDRGTDENRLPEESENKPKKAPIVQIPFWIGLFNVSNKKHVPLLGTDQIERLDAQYLLCFSNHFCPYYDSEGHVTYTSPQLLKNARGHSQIDRRYHKKLDVGLKAMNIRLWRTSTLQSFADGIKEWCESNTEKFNDGKSFILALVDHYESEKALLWPESKTFAEVREEISTLLDSLKEPH
ncbi:hypothetical protein EV360DRAFT_74210 [Lentinula raphanica]|nr:hypothetical protein EV360DRAFT_74210 [Lentinula raphanica]